MASGMSCGLRYIVNGVVNGVVPVSINTVVGHVAAFSHILRCDHLDHLRHLKSGSVFDVALHGDINIAALRGTLA